MNLHLPLGGIPEPHDIIGWLRRLKVHEDEEIVLRSLLLGFGFVDIPLPHLESFGLDQNVNRTASIRMHGHNSHARGVCQGGQGNPGG